MDYFTIVEINLLCIYNTASRASLLSDLSKAFPDIDEPEMRDVFVSAIDKLEHMSDADYTNAAADFIPAVDDEDEDIE